MTDEELISLFNDSQAEDDVYEELENHLYGKVPDDDNENETFIADEACRLIGLFLGERVEKGSSVEYIVSAAVSAGFRLAREHSQQT